MNWFENMTGVGNLPDEVGSDINWDEYIQSQLNSTPLPQGSQDIDKDLNQWTSDYWADYINSQQNSTPLPQGSQDIDKDLAEWSKLGGSGLSKIGNILKNFGGKALNFAQTPQGIMTLLSAFAALKDRQGKIGGGAKQGMMAPRQYTRTMTQGAYGPIARYAANGGLMQAYAQGGHVQMEDGGFVMTKKAVDGAGGPQGLASLVPGARMIGGPPDPTGRKDLTSAVIKGPNGVTPAKVSSGEAYVPKRVVDENGGAKQMYALMNSLQRRA